MRKQDKFKVGMLVQLPKNFNLRQHRCRIAWIEEIDRDVLTIVFCDGERVSCTFDDLNAQRIVSQRQRFSIMQRDGFRCQLCGRDASDGIKLHIDHRTSYEDSGKTVEENLWTLCNECNQGKGARSIK